MMQERSEHPVEHVHLSSSEWPTLTSVEDAFLIPFLSRAEVVSATSSEVRYGVRATLTSCHDGPLLDRGRVILAELYRSFLSTLGCIKRGGDAGAVTENQCDQLHKSRNVD